MSCPVLIVAHPGHELRLFGWMCAVRPIVCILTDGSGSTGAARTRYSLDLLEKCGASAGPVMGRMSDKLWYSAILEGNSDPFLQAADDIRSAADLGSLVLADPVEGYNPMHDLSAAIADRVASLVGGERATYPLIDARDGGTVLRLDSEAAMRKQAAVTAYSPLADEVRALSPAGESELHVERLLPEAFAWPETFGSRPRYETFGADRAAAGTYGQVITYARHVRPIAQRLRTERPPGATPGKPAHVFHRT